MIAGGGTNSNNNFGILNPPSTNINPLNITGQPDYYQDIADIVIDPATNDLFTLFPIGYASNIIYKNHFPYSSSSISLEFTNRIQYNCRS